MLNECLINGSKYPVKYHACTDPDHFPEWTDKFHHLGRGVVYSVEDQRQAGIKEYEFFLWLRVKK
jgi:hypothetical protein